MQGITTIGLDIAKSVFQVHGIDDEGEVVVRQQLRRSRVLGFFKKLSPCLVGVEACASSHHWSRELQALGHTVRLMPPAYVKPYLKRQIELLQPRMILAMGRFAVQSLLRSEEPIGMLRGRVHRYLATNPRGGGWSSRGATV